MLWLNSHLPLILSCLAAAGLVCGLVGPRLPAGRARNVVLALAHLLPGDVAQAVGKLAAGASPVDVVTAEAAKLGGASGGGK
jgi:hypothetical protein